MLRVKRYSSATRAYNSETLNKAVAAVKAKRMTTSQAAREYYIPRKTLDDHVKKNLSLRPGPPSILSQEEESALVEYLQYTSKQGFPMSRQMVRQFIITICKADDRPSLFNLEKGPSDKWFRIFLTRHPELTEQKSQVQDRGRTRMSNQNVMDQFFALLSSTLDENGLKDKPAQIFNCDETGWSGKEKSHQKFFTSKGHPCYQQRILGQNHITAHLCIAADGRVLPTFLIFEKSLPHTTYKEGVPNSWMFGYSESGYMDSQLFLSWFKEVFLENCGSKKPVMLIMDNHDSHINMEVIKLARENDVILLGLPAHTTHLLQPLDVNVNGPLKAKFSSLATSLGFISKHQVLNKAKFPVVLSHAIDQACSPALIKDSFRKTGIFPFNPDCIDKNKLTPSQKFTSSSSSTCHSSTSIQPVSSSSELPPSIPSTSSSSELPPSIPSTSSSSELPPSIPSTSSSSELPPSIPSTSSSSELPPSIPSTSSSSELPPSIPSTSSSSELPPSIPSTSSSSELPPSIPSTSSSSEISLPIQPSSSSAEIPPIIHASSTNSEMPAVSNHFSTSTCSSDICKECGTFLGGNPLVTEGLVPQHLADIFRPVPAKPFSINRRKMVTEARVISTEEFLKKLEEKEEEERQKKENVQKRKRERELKKSEKLKEKESKKSKKDDTYKCRVCRRADPKNSSGDTVWIMCDICELWYHPGCVGVTDEDMEDDDLLFKCDSCLEE